MAETKRRYPKEVFAQRGDAIYKSVVQPTLTPEDDGKFVAIDIETSEFEVDKDEMKAGDRLHTKLPTAQFWMVRVGSPFVRRFGGRGLRGKS